MSQGPVAETPAKPSIIRQVLPWVFAVAIVGYMFTQVNFHDVLDALTAPNTRPSWIIGAFLVYCAVYYFTDVLSFMRAYSWFNTPMTFNETLKLRFASYAVQAVNGALTEIMCVLYMLRVKKVPVTQATSSAGFVYFNETLTLVTLLTYCAFFLPAGNRIQVDIMGIPFWSLFQGLIVAAWIAAPLWVIFWRSGAADKFPRLRDNGLLVAFKHAPVRRYLEVFAYRFSNNFISLLANVVMLKALGIEAPFALMVAVVPIMVNVAYWPVSAGGFGGPQLVAHFLLKGHATESEIFAYSLVWSALFFLTRTATGLPFLLPVYRAAFPEKSSQ